MTANAHSSAGPHRDYRQSPLIVTWEVTQACALECDHCRADAQPDRDPDELTIAEGKQLIDQIATFTPTPPIIVFSGGDPLERPDLFELLEYAATVGLRTAVAPAPTSSLTNRVLDKFVDHGVHRIALSLDGASSATHDAFRGVPGSFETVRRAADYASSIDLPVQINTTVTRSTRTELPAIADRVEALQAVMWEVFFLVQIGRGTRLHPLSALEAERTLVWLYRRQRPADFQAITVEAPQYRRIALESDGDREHPVGTTGDGNGFVFVSHTGDVYPSGFLPVPIGEVPAEDVVSLYRSDPLVTRLRDPDSRAGPCGRCSYRSYCGGSRARAYAATGDPFASDPLCPYNPDLEAIVGIRSE